MKYLTRPGGLLAATLILLVIIFLIIEGIWYSIKPLESQKAVLLEKSLKYAEATFNRAEQQLQGNTRELATRLQQLLQNRGSKTDIQALFTPYNRLWGITLFKNNTPLVWKGYGFNRYPPGVDSTDLDTGTPITDVRKQDNVLYLLCYSIFEQAEGDSTATYSLFTSDRIEQRNALPIGRTSEYHLLERPQNSFSHPVSLSFFNPLPAVPLEYRTLYTSAGDSVGVAYAISGDFSEAQQQWKSNLLVWRWTFLVAAGLIILGFIYFWLGRKRSWSALFLQIAVFATAWAGLHIASVNFPIEGWLASLTTTGSTAATQPLITFMLDGLFMFLLAVTLGWQLSKRTLSIRSSWYPATMFNALLMGLASSALITWGILKGYHLIERSQIPIFDLRLFPELSTLLLYIGLGLILYSLVYGLNVLYHFIFRSGRDEFKYFAVLITAGFGIGLFLLQIYLPSGFTLNWVALVTLSAFGASLTLALLRVVYPSSYRNFSMLRKLAIGSLFIAMLSVPMLYHAYTSQLRQSLISTAEDFTEREDAYARNITEQMLVTLENEFNNLTETDLLERKPYIQSRFNQEIEQVLTSEWRSYSFDLQFIDLTGNYIAGFSTDLNSPDWVEIFDLRNLSAAMEIERITKSTNRPVIQFPELINSENYDTFYRGWIPIFSSENSDQIAWILCSVYRERPDFDKPMRAVMASLTYDDWRNSYQIIEYQDGTLQRSVKKGVTGYYPTFHQLKPAERDLLQGRSRVFVFDQYQEIDYLYLLDKASDRQVIKASTILPGARTLLYTFFRMSFLFLMIGLLAYGLVYLVNSPMKINLKSQNKFQNRILDSFLLAILVFLGLLIVTTHYAIKQQNEEIVKQELTDKLDGLTSATNSGRWIRNNTGEERSSVMDSLVFPLDADVSYYRGRKLAGSTTPQIYQQHLLPDMLPFGVYLEMYEQHRRDVMTKVSLASQPLIIGYRSILSEKGQPVAVAAIPTFLQSPKYDQQLLETTSYLIGFYLLVFGLFVIGTALLSKQLTKPLSYIQKGLNKISKGNLETTIPVKTRDEIGSLARAYNTMVDELKDLQEELAMAEREAAWQEMAQQVAHEIKNPLTPMKLNLQHLERQLSGNDQNPEELKQRIKKITANLVEQIQSLSNIASDFSKFSKPIDEEFVEVDLHRVIRSVADLYRHHDELQLDTELTEKEFNVMGVPDELKRVMINLVKNSFEAVSGQGTIVIRTYLKQQSVFVEVEDDGCGIPEEDKPRIFVPNFSTKSSGTGLGLAICKKIIEAHKGSISFASIEEKGTTFVIKLPVDRDSSSQ